MFRGCSFLQRRLARRLAPATCLPSTLRAVWDKQPRAGACRARAIRPRRLDARQPHLAERTCQVRAHRRCVCREGLRCGVAHAPWWHGSPSTPTEANHFCGLVIVPAEAAQRTPIEQLLVSAGSTTCLCVRSFAELRPADAATLAATMCMSPSLSLRVGAALAIYRHATRHASAAESLPPVVLDALCAVVLDCDYASAYVATTPDVTVRLLQVRAPPHRLAMHVLTRLAYFHRHAAGTTRSARTPCRTRRLWRTCASWAWHPRVSPPRMCLR